MQVIIGYTNKTEICTFVKTQIMLPFADNYIVRLTTNQRPDVKWCTGWPKKVSHHQFKKNRIKDCQRD